ncbi:glycosyltransferase family 4 protein [Streptomyces olivoreticuli]|uniref:glycosyltransferase family 4 protein n=1 Tax=Streptomyces olivoreticuli TaxID=68246 RepID=UPI002659B9BE|nr:glycosyltransferase family 4 protein [Streptomyces olivoreticuli]WKK24897.1 glycosyltransferase family 4 protein [Streptomyces olivoreticuli]
MGRTDRARPRILFASANESAPWGPSETNWALAAGHWLGLGADIHASVKGWEEVPAELAALERAGCAVHRRWDPPPHDQRPVHELPWSERQSSILTKLRPDLVVVSQGDNYEGLGWMEECLERGFPYVAYSNSASEYEWCTDDVAERLSRAYAGALASFFVSEGNRELTERQVGGPIVNARVVRCHFKVDYAAAPPWPEAGDGRVRMACPARLDPNSKGHDVLFDVLALPKWRERPLAVSLYGAGAHERVLRALRDRLGLTNVEFAGYAEDIESVWRTHHGLLLCSRAEGLPTVIVEAMLCGRPVVVSDVAGNAELLQDGVTGFVAAGPVAACFDEALERAWQRRAEWPEIGRRAAEAVRREIPPDPIALLVEQFRELARG